LYRQNNFCGSGVNGKKGGQRLEPRPDMEMPSERAAAEITRLRRCISDLVSVTSLPATWAGDDQIEIVRSLLAALLPMLSLDFAYVRLKDPRFEQQTEMVRVAESYETMTRPRDVGELLDRLLGPDPQTWSSWSGNLFGDGDISIVPMRLGLHGDIGVLVVGSGRADFPAQTEVLLLSVATNQAAVSLQDALLLRKERQHANELEQRVAQRTKELASSNEELKKEIAERKLAEIALRKSEAFLAEAQRLSSTGSFSWRVARNGITEIIWSDELYRIFEFDRSLPITLELMRTRIHPEDLALFERTIDRARTAAGGFDYEHRLQMSDGSVKHLQVIARGTRDSDGQLEYIGAAQDVTQARLSEEILAQARLQLVHATRVTSLGVLTASISHEVKQPLAAIVANAESSLRWLARSAPDIERVRLITSLVIADARRASEIVDRIRDMASQRTPERIPLSFDDVVYESLRFLGRELQLKEISVSVDLARELPQVVGDRTQLQQVVVNLIMNAAQAMAHIPPADRCISISANLSDPETVCCTIEDCGPGIDPAHLPHLFNSFFTTKDTSMGLGLAICQSIVEAHGGRIRADNNSTLGGARFSLDLMVHGAD
jgi:signal transduction histidine kinase